MLSLQINPTTELKNKAFTEREFFQDAKASLDLVVSVSSVTTDFSL